MDIRNKYQSELGNKFRYFPNWLPNRPIEIGDVGILHKNHFESEYSLLKRNPKVLKYKTSEYPSNISYYSEGTAKIKLQGSAELPQPGNSLKANQEMRILFDKANSILLEAKGALISRIEMFDELRTELINLYKQDEWNLDYVIVTEVVKAEYLTVVITNKKNAEIVLQTDNNVKLVDSDLATLQATFSIANQKGTQVCLIGESKTVPLFRLRKLKKNIFKEKVDWDKDLYSKTDQTFSIEEIELVS